MATCQIVGWLDVGLWEAAGFGRATSPPVKPVSLCMCGGVKVAICGKTLQDQLRHSSESSGLEVSWSESSSRAFLLLKLVCSAPRSQCPFPVKERGLRPLQLLCGYFPLRPTCWGSSKALEAAAGQAVKSFPFGYIGSHLEPAVLPRV